MPPARSITPLLTSATLLAAVLAAPTAAAAQPVDRPLEQSSRAAAVEPRDRPDPQVLAISIDALNPDALRRLGRDRAPALWRLVDEGAGTLNARSQLEQTLTLPNHTSMVTGRRINAAQGGHGVTWNDDLPGHPLTAQEAAGHTMESLFSVAHAAGSSTALFATKTKLSLLQRSWPEGLDRVTIKEERDAALVRAVRRDLLGRDRGLTFLHLGRPDEIGHANGFMGRAYLRAVRRIDALLAKVLEDADTHAELDDLTVILTADHGGQPGTTSHDAARKLADYRVPFTVWGPGISPADLYDINPGYRDPHRRRPGLAGRQPVRNGDVANTALGLLGLDPVRGSLFGAKRPLRLGR